MEKIHTLSILLLVTISILSIRAYVRAKNLYDQQSIFVDALQRSIEELARKLRLEKEKNSQLRDRDSFDKTAKQILNQGLSMINEIIKNESEGEEWKNSTKEQHDNSLESQLQRALDNENYEEAERLRKLINKRSNNGE